MWAPIETDRPEAVGVHGIGSGSANVSTGMAGPGPGGGVVPGGPSTRRQHPVGRIAYASSVITTNTRPRGFGPGGREIGAFRDRRV